RPGGRRRRRDRLPRERHRGHPHLDAGSGPAAPHHGSHDPRGLRCAHPAGVRDGARSVTQLDQTVAGAQGARPAAGRGRRTTRRGGERRGPWAAWISVLPALAVYSFFTLQSLAKSVQYSFYSWNGIGEARWVGLANYAEVFSDPRRVTALANAFKLIFFYSFLSIALGLIAATLIRGLNSRGSRASQTILFLPQVVPLVGAGIAWTWLYSSDGAINQFLSAIGLGSITRAWLADFTFALP